MFGFNVKDVLTKLGPFTIEWPFKWTGDMEDERMILNRTNFTDVSTIGELYIDGKFNCYTLELSARKQDSVKNCIAPGAYEVQVTYSTRFKKDMPVLMNVPGYEGIRIHPGNSSVSTDGCILVGTTKEKDWIGNSVVAFNSLYKIIENKLRNGKLFIEITGNA